MSFQDYAQYISRKYCLAVAIAIIKSKPENLNIGEYINILRNKCDESKMEVDIDLTLCEDDFNLDEDLDNPLLDISNDSVTILKDFNIDDVENQESTKSNQINPTTLLDVIEVFKDIDKNTMDNNNAGKSTRNTLSQSTFFESLQLSQENIISDITTNVDNDLTFCESLSQKDERNNERDEILNDINKETNKNINKINSEQTQLYTLHGFTDINTHISQSQDQLVISNKYLQNKSKADTLNNIITENKQNSANNLNRDDNNSVNNNSHSRHPFYKATNDKIAAEIDINVRKHKNVDRFLSEDVKRAKVDQNLNAKDINIDNVRRSKNAEIEVLSQYVSFDIEDTNLNAVKILGNETIVPSTQRAVTIFNNKPKIDSENVIIDDNLSINLSNLEDNTSNDLISNDAQNLNKHEIYCKTNNETSKILTPAIHNSFSLDEFEFSTSQSLSQSRDSLYENTIYSTKNKETVISQNKTKFIYQDVPDFRQKYNLSQENIARNEEFSLNDNTKTFSQRDNANYNSNQTINENCMQTNTKFDANSNIDIDKEIEITKCNTNERVDGSKYDVSELHSDISDDVTESQTEVISFKVLEELSKVKGYLNKRERKISEGNASDSGYKTCSQQKSSYRSAQYISRKYCLAVAIAIIKSKPENLNIGEYINILRNKCDESKMEVDIDLTLCEDDFNLDEDLDNPLLDISNDSVTILKDFNIDDVENQESTKSNQINPTTLLDVIEVFKDIDKNTMDNNNAGKSTRNTLSQSTFFESLQLSQENIISDITTNVDNDLTFCESLSQKDERNNERDEILNDINKETNKNINKINSEQTQLYTLHGFTDINTHISQTQDQLVISNKYLQNKSKADTLNNIIIENKQNSANNLNRDDNYSVNNNNSHSRHPFYKATNDKIAAEIDINVRKHKNVDRFLSEDVKRAKVDQNLNAKDIYIDNVKRSKNAEIEVLSQYVSFDIEDTNLNAVKILGNETIVPSTQRAVTIFNNKPKIDSENVIIDDNLSINLSNLEDNTSNDLISNDAQNLNKHEIYCKTNNETSKILTPVIHNSFSLDEFEFSTSQSLSQSRDSLYENTIYSTKNKETVTSQNKTKYIYQDVPDFRQNNDLSQENIARNEEFSLNDNTKTFSQRDNANYNSNQTINENCMQTNTKFDANSNIDIDKEIEITKCNTNERVDGSKYDVSELHSDISDDVTESQTEVISFKVLEELSKVKGYLNKRERKISEGNASDSGYKTCSQQKSSYRSGINSSGSLNESAHCLLNYIMCCPLTPNTVEITSEISKVHSSHQAFTRTITILESWISPTEVSRLWKEYVAAHRKARHQSQHDSDRPTLIWERVEMYLPHQPCRNIPCKLLQQGIGLSSLLFRRAANIVLGNLVDKLHEEEKYPDFLEKILDSVGSFIRDVYESCGDDENILLKKEEFSQRLFLLNRSSHIIQYSIEKITNILENLTEMTKEATLEITDTERTENLCYIFHILEVLLKRNINVQNHLSQNSSQHSQDEDRILKKSSLTEIWRKKWNLTRSEVCEGSLMNAGKKCVLSKCGEILNKIIVQCMDGYSLISFAALQCFNLLQN